MSSTRQHTAGEPTVYAAIRERDPEIAFASAELDFDPDRPHDPIGAALLIDRRTTIIERIRLWPYWMYVDGKEIQVSREEFTAAGKKLDLIRSPWLLELYVAAGLWEPLPPHEVYRGRDLTGADWRLHSAIHKAFMARDKKKIAAAIRKADKENHPLLAYAIVREARKMGLDPKIKKYDF